MIKVGVNGFGRIGRNFLRASLESGADLGIADRLVIRIGSVVKDTGVDICRQESRIGNSSQWSSRNRNASLSRIIDGRPVYDSAISYVSGEIVLSLLASDGHCFRAAVKRRIASVSPKP